MSETATASATTKPKSDQCEIGALWKKTSSTQKYLTGVLNLVPLGINKQINVVIFSNKFKKAENHPDLRVYLSKPKEPVVATKPAAPTKAAVQAPEPEPAPDDEII